MAALYFLNVVTCNKGRIHDFQDSGTPGRETVDVLNQSMHRHFERKQLMSEFIKLILHIIRMGPY